MIEKIFVRTGKPYEVLVGKGILNNVGELIRQIIAPCKVAVITDTNVEKLYFSTVEKSLLESGYQVVKFTFTAGEQSKNLTTYCEILSFLAENGFTRTDLVVALGGGVVGDMAGFASATYLRGVKFVQIPTTLLAQIDSSVGGKTAVDLPQGKNLVGAFYQPSLVVCDIAVLDDLPKEVFLDGLGEMVKYALLDKDIFAEFTGENNMEKLVKACVDYKRKVVEEDEFENGIRKFLNLGHTVGHAIEKASDFSITHGRAVGLGLRVITQYSYKKGYLSKTDFDNVMALLDDTVSGENPPYSSKTLAKYALLDKKRAGDNVTVITVHGVGDCRLTKLPIAEIEELFKVRYDSKNL